MNRIITPTILILISIALLMFFINPTFSRIKEARIASSAYNTALNKSKELQGLRDSILTEYNTFSASNIDKLKKMVPDHVDNVRLIIEIDAIASQYGMTVRDAKLSSEDSSNDEKLSIFEAQSSDTQQMTLNFSVASSYDNFLKFLRDLEQNLRIVDIEAVNFNSSDTDLYEYDITIKTYWLTQNN